jgi:hypothetical protein
MRSRGPLPHMYSVLRILWSKRLKNCGAQLKRRYPALSHAKRNCNFNPASRQTAYPDFSTSHLASPKCWNSPELGCALGQSQGIRRSLLVQSSVRRPGDTFAVLPAVLRPEDFISLWTSIDLSRCCQETENQQCQRQNPGLFQAAVLH